MCKKGCMTIDMLEAGTSIYLLRNCCSYVITFNRNENEHVENLVFFDVVTALRASDILRQKYDFKVNLMTHDKINQHSYC